TSSSSSESPGSIRLNEKVRSAAVAVRYGVPCSVTSTSASRAPLSAEVTTPLIEPTSASCSSSEASAVCPGPSVTVRSTGTYPNAVYRSVYSPGATASSNAPPASTSARQLVPSTSTTAWERGCPSWSVTTPVTPLCCGSAAHRTALRKICRPASVQSVVGELLNVAASPVSSRCTLSGVRGLYATPIPDGSSPAPATSASVTPEYDGKAAASVPSTRICTGSSMPSKIGWSARFSRKNAGPPVPIQFCAGGSPVCWMSRSTPRVLDAKPTAGKITLTPAASKAASAARKVSRSTAGGWLRITTSTASSASTTSQPASSAGSPLARRRLVSWPLRSPTTTTAGAGVSAASSVVTCPSTTSTASTLCDW